MGTIIGEGITFDDVLLVPQYSEVTPNMIDLTTNLTKKIKLNILNVNVVLFAYPHAFDDAGIELWVGLNAWKLVDFLAFE